jgi:hypothetical protein
VDILSKHKINLVFFRFIVSIIFLLVSPNSGAQTYLGISLDAGNQVTIYPNPDALLKRPIAFSGSIMLYRKEEIRNHWYLQYGVTIGSLGFRIKAREIDTLRNDPNFYDPYSSYSTLFVSGHFTMGKRFVISSKNISLYLGGGATHYFYFLDIPSEGSWAELFEYEMLLTNSRLKGFAEVSVQTDINPRISTGVLFRYHFKPALTGNYNFYNITEPLNGTLSLNQRAISILFLVKIGKKL